MFTTEAAVLLIFSGCNALRLLAYLQQIWSLARSTSDAPSVSHATSSIVFVTHLSTVAYLLTVAADRVVPVSFAALNAAACLAIVAVALAKRRRTARPFRFA
jgi:hypothetical protein